jgi:elongation factor Ts
MAEITAALVKQLREATDCGMMDCKKALVECDGDMKKATEYLQVKGLAKAAKRGARETSEGYIGVYRHHDGKTAIIVEVNCETDFVARNEDFRFFCNELALHICGCNPAVVSRENVDPAVIAEKRELFVKQLDEDPKNAKKPAEIREKIVNGKVDSWLGEISLLDQKWMGDGDDTVEQKRAAICAVTGENIRIKRFARISVGEK